MECNQMTSKVLFKMERQCKSSTAMEAEGMFSDDVFQARSK